MLGRGQASVQMGNGLGEREWIKGGKRKSGKEGWARGQRLGRVGQGNGDWGGQAKRWTNKETDMGMDRKENGE